MTPGIIHKILNRSGKEDKPQSASAAYILFTGIFLNKARHRFKPRLRVRPHSQIDSKKVPSVLIYCVMKWEVHIKISTHLSATLVSRKTTYTGLSGRLN